jgi:tetratricopeptide (TPR) repeat protein
VKENNYEKALEGYDNALKIGPDMKYPNEQAAKLRAFLEKRKAAEETYKAAVTAGDGFFKAKEYEKAKAEYNKAAVLKTDDESLTKKLGDLNRLLSHKQPAGVGKINEKDFNDE